MKFLEKITKCFKRDTEKSNEQSNSGLEDAILIMQKIIDEEKALKEKAKNSDLKKEIGLYLMDIGKLAPSRKIANGLKQLIEEELKENGLDTKYICSPMYGMHGKIRQLENKIRLQEEEINKFKSLQKSNKEEK